MRLPRTSRKTACFALLLAVGCGAPEQNAARTAGCPSAGELVITEVMANPPGTDQQEWVEIYNATDRALDLSGLALHLESVGTTSHALSGGSLEPGAFFVLGGVSDADRPSFIDYGYGSDLGYMPNGAAVLEIRCDEGPIDSAAYIGPSDGISLELDGALAPDAIANDSLDHWCESTRDFGGLFLGSPGTSNDPCVGPAQSGQCVDEEGRRDIRAPGPGDLRITEYMADPAAAADAEGEWIEVWVAAGVDRVDLNGLELRIADASVARIESDDCATVSEGQYLVFARSKAPEQNGGLPAVDFELSFALPNTGSVMSIVVDGGTIDEVEYGPAKSGVASQADQAFETGALVVPWCEAGMDEAYGGGDLGTPGAPNGPCAPVLRAGQCWDQGTPRDIAPPTAGGIFISEYMGDPGGVPDALGEWMELHLVDGADLNGVTIHTQSSSLTLDGADCLWRGAGSQVLLARSTVPTENGGLPAPDFTFGFNIVNGPGVLSLESMGEMLHEVAYAGTSPSTAASLDLSTVGTSTEVWCPATTSYGDQGNLGTPGSLNPACN